MGAQYSATRTTLLSQAGLSCGELHLPSWQVLKANLGEYLFQLIRRKEVTVSTVFLVIVALGAVAVVALTAYFSVSRYKRYKARDEFGPEFERVARERGSEREAERELRTRRERVNSRIRPLSDDGRRRYREEWERVERTFVDNPLLALDQADRVVTDILSERNFPTESRKEATEAVGVTYSKVVEDFRDAQRTHASTIGSNGEGGTSDESMEEMRKAIQKYRSVFDRLI